MRWEVRLFFEDRDRNRRSVSTWLLSANTVAELVAFANGFGDAVSGLSNGRLVAARLTARVPSSLVTVAAESSDVRQKLLLILKDSTGIGSIVVPSPADLPWESSGPYAGIRIRRQDYPAAGPVAVNLGALAGTARPDGLPFPAPDDWVIARLHR